MDWLLILHTRLANAVVIFMLLMGLWGVLNFIRRLPVTPNYFGALVIGEGLVLAQSLLGISLFAFGLRAGGLIHYLYGIMTIISLPAAFAYLQGDTSRKATTIYALVCLFIFGLGVRGILTARGG